ncbi:MAG: hypothetical protein JXA90_10650, partial [Planctomycetes bacterium]|nr:hypothetical protein [Planctomycetota bacterium]
MVNGVPEVVFPEMQGNDLLASIRTYLQQHLPDSSTSQIEQYLEGLRNGILDNRKTDIHGISLLSGLSKPERTRAEALIADIGVLLTQRRNQLLRDAHRGSFTEADLDRLFDDVCLDLEAPLDPDLPKVAAQAVVHCSTQTALMKRVSRELERVRGQIETAPEDARQPGASLLPLGKLLVFLRWIPYDWAEEIALEVLDSVHPASHVDRLRLWISVLRVFFCRPSVTAGSVSRLVQGIEDEFGWPAPMELRNLLRTVLIKGGHETERILLRLFDKRPEIYNAAFFLDALGMIDKPVAAAWLSRHRDALLPRLGVETYLRLFTKTGETGMQAHALLMDLWNHGKTATRLQCLDAVEELHFAEMAPFLLSRLEEEDDPHLRFRLVETVADSGGAGDLRSLSACVRNERSALRYYTMHLIHRRLLDTPALLAMQDDSVLLHDIQSARADLYDNYTSLLSFRTALLHARDPAGAGPIADDATGGLPAWHEKLAGAVRVLRGRSLVFERVQANIYGSMRSRLRAGDLLDDTDLAVLASGVPSAEEDLNALVEKADRSIEFLLETFVWQEWFVREIPFVLSEEIEVLIERIRNGEPMTFETEGLENPAQIDRLRTTFGIFCECTRQGIYLTDGLLTHILHFPREEWADVIRHDLTRRRVMVSDKRLVYHPGDQLARHLQFTTFAHDYRYGKESLDQPSMVYLWLKYIEESRRIQHVLEGEPWPALPSHPDVPEVIGPLTARMYDQHAREAEAVAGVIESLHERAGREGFEMRVIPNLTYGLFCLAPVIEKVIQRGIHVSLAGVSSQFCDDENINRFFLGDGEVFPLKRYVFSNASNYGTLNRDRILVVIDGTMEPIDRHDAGKIRLPKAYRGFVNHLAAVNYVRARYGYKMENAERDVASALNLPLQFVRNLVRTHDFRHLLDSLLLCFDPDKLAESHEAAGTGKTYYTFAQWNPDGMPARVGPSGFKKHEIACTAPGDLACPSLLFVSMNSIFNETGVAAYFDNNPEVEHPRMFIGPQGVRMDIGWPG